MADAHTEELTEDTAPDGDDLVYVVHDPAGTPADRKVKVVNVGGVPVGYKPVTTASEDDTEAGSGQFTCMVVSDDTQIVFALKRVSDDFPFFGVTTEGKVFVNDGTSQLGNGLQIDPTDIIANAGDLTLQATGDFSFFGNRADFRATGDDLTFQSDTGQIIFNTETLISTNPTARVGFYGHATVAQQTGVAVTAAGIHAALVALGLITA